ncbi:Zn-dependent protease with chaperone function [Ereboglobus sp. PH5-10]|uniref:M48 family metalloprotease n=2 Tax=unclassified Ereboglobus TaxID=2626932 RepID=UPI002406F5AE|nr:M48 family metalloprotease [Ereboglobus sp. PH5-10]MDF9828159.1 Zn-dependent protease with chaperone function [Ereboglobus sp. PH5-10]
MNRAHKTLFANPPFPMDFFSAQARARKKTRQLIVLFAAAIVFLVALSYAILAVIRAGWLYYYEPGSAFQFWQPGLLAFLIVMTCGLVGGASWWKWRQLSKDGLLVIKSLGARWVSPGSANIIERRLVNIVEEMAIASGVPAPAIFLIENEQAINAFACGLKPQDAAIVVTRGALDHLTRDELQGVIGHEFSHILNNDIRMNVVLMAVVHGLLFMALAGEGIFKDWNLLEESPFYFMKVIVAMVRVPVGIAVSIFGYTGYFLGRLIIATISRQREYLSDAAAVQFTRNPSGLTGALRKIGLSGGVVVTSKNVRAIQHFFFVDACRNHLGRWFATHPYWLDRVRAIDAQTAKFIVSDSLDRGRLVTDDSDERPAVAGRRKAGLRLKQKIEAPSFGEGGPAANISTGENKTDPAENRAAMLQRLLGASAPESIARARQLLDSINPELLDAAHCRDTAPALVLGLLIDRDETVRHMQWDAFTFQGGAPLKIITRLEPALLRLPLEHRLPLLQLALPTLRMMPGQDVGRFWQAADKIAQCDGRITVFEYSLLRMVQRHLVSVAATPLRKTNKAFAQPSEIGAHAGMALSMLANCGGADEGTSRKAFEAGKSKLGRFAVFAKWHRPQTGEVEGAAMIQQLYRPLDTALDRLATAPLETRRAVLAAAAAVVMADGKQHIEEIELLRMMSDSLGCPMPLV